MNRLSLWASDIFKGESTMAYLNRFERLLHSSKEEIEEYRFRKLRALLLHCEANVPFYKKRFGDSGFSAREFSSMEQIKLIPPLTRQDLQNNWKEIIAENYAGKKLSAGSSSGSTGQPVFYRKDSRAASAGQAAHLLGWSLSGWKMSMKGLHIWGNPTTVIEEWGRLSSKIKARIFRHHKYPAYMLHDGSRFRELYQLIDREKYDYLDGYTNVIYHFADYLKSRGLAFRHKIKYVLTTAENLHSYQRRTIEEVIAPVYDTYGCSEINSIAFECRSCKKYHVIDPHVYVEFGQKLDQDGNSELMITDLDNYAFPLIRYKNGDLGVQISGDEPDCEIRFSRLAGISGRETDLITLSDGGVLSVPSFFGSMLLKKVNGLRQYQIEKVKDDLIIINLVRTEAFTPDDMNIIESALREYIQGRIRYEIRFVDSIDLSGTGKFKLVKDSTGKSSEADE
jgi:phenylacetate-CoA ligase